MHHFSDKKASLRFNSSVWNIGKLNKRNINMATSQKCNQTWANVDELERSSGLISNFCNPARKPFLAFWPNLQIMILIS